MFRTVPSRLVLAPMLLLASCQAGRTYVIESMPPRFAVDAVAIREGASTADVDADLKAHFERTLRERLANDDHPVPPALRVDDGAPLTVEYRFILNDPGSAATRVGAAIVSVAGVPMGALGEGTVAIDVVYRDADGHEISRIIADGPIDGPVGTSKSGLATAARSIAKFTRELVSRGSPTMASLGQLEPHAPAGDSQRP